jgi:chromosome segregation ATPase
MNLAHLLTCTDETETENLETRRQIESEWEAKMQSMRELRASILQNAEILAHIDELSNANAELMVSRGRREQFAKRRPSVPIGGTDSQQGDGFHQTLAIVAAQNDIPARRCRCEALAHEIQELQSQYQTAEDHVMALESQVRECEARLRRYSTPLSLWG